MHMMVIPKFLLAHWLQRSVNIPILSGETSVKPPGQEAPAGGGLRELPAVEPIYRYGTFGGMLTGKNPLEEMTMGITCGKTR